MTRRAEWFNNAVMRIFSCCLLAVLLSISAIAQVASTLPEIPAWTPPSPRVKAFTLFAPKPIGGDNIFKGEKEGWLADAIIKLEIGQLDPIKDQAVSDYISQLGQNLVKYSTAPKKTYQFVVLDRQWANAFNIGSGRVCINLGMLEAVESEDELAGVLAHEIGHDAFAHAPKTVTRQMFWMTGTRKVKTAEEAEKELDKLNAALEENSAAVVGERMLGFSRFEELEADRAAFYNIYKAGYNPEAVKAVFQRYVAEEKADAGENYAGQVFLTLLFGSHPTVIAAYHRDEMGI